jgi:protein-L-isoaspartate(D-aspartate) O-methyltransferase
LPASSGSSCVLGRGAALAFGRAGGGIGIAVVSLFVASRSAAWRRLAQHSSHELRPAASRSRSWDLLVLEHDIVMRFALGEEMFGPAARAVLARRSVVAGFWGTGARAAMTQEVLESAFAGEAQETMGHADGYRGVMTSNEELIRALTAAGIRDRRVLHAFRGVPRDRFVPSEWQQQAYEDVPLPIDHGQVTTQPSLSARMIEALELTGCERVLEVGTGYGFQTALLATLAGEVWSVERWTDIAQVARVNLTGCGIDNAHVVAGDGSLGLPEESPFDAILVAAAFPAVPPPLTDQLPAGGRLVQPIGPGGREEVTLFVKHGDRLVRNRVLTGANFVRLIGQHGFDRG